MDLVIFNDNEEEVIKVIQLARQYGLNVNQQDYFECTLVHRVASEERQLVLRWLSLQNEVDARVKNNNGQTAVWVAAKRGNRLIVRILNSMGAQINEKAYIMSGGERKSVEEVARMKGHVELTNKVDERIQGKMLDNGKQMAQSLKDVTIVTISDNWQTPMLI